MIGQTKNKQTTLFINSCKPKMKHNETPESRLVWWSVGAVLIMHTITNDIWVALTGCYVVQFSHCIFKAIIPAA